MIRRVRGGGPLGDNVLVTEAAPHDDAPGDPPLPPPTGPGAAGEFAVEPTDGVSIVAATVPANVAPWPVTTAGPGPSVPTRSVPTPADEEPPVTRAQLRAAQHRRRGDPTRRLWTVLGVLALVGILVFVVAGRNRSADPTAAPAVAPGTPTASLAGPLGQAEDLARLAGVRVIDTGAGRAPDVQLPQRPLQVAATARRALRGGTGRVAAPGATVRVAGVTVRGSDATVVENSYGDPQLVTLTPQTTLPGLVGALTGAQPGARLLVAIPPAEAFGAQGNPQLGVAAAEHLVFVFDVLDVLPDSADGAAVAPAPGLPTVTVDATGPHVQVPQAAPPTALVSQPLLAGVGPPVRAGQTVVVHYLGVLWKDGAVVDTSWQTREPFPVPGIGQADVIPAWNKALVGVRVGTRLLLIVPPAEGYGAAGSPPSIAGTDTLVFVVDVLAAY